jgi:antirestriction protein ArdC
MNTSEKLFDTYFNLLVSKVESISEDWEQPWIRLKGFAPRNLRGNKYNAGNAFFLSLLSEWKGYTLPVFFTFLQAKQENVLICKGESSFPVVFYRRYVVHKETGHSIPEDEYNLLSKDEKEDYKFKFTLNYYKVFNIEQTNFSEVHPERFQKIADEANQRMPETNDYSHEALNELLHSWYCPIRVQRSNKACYAPTLDYIVLPLKEQFARAEQFYSTMLHEMAHSTGHKDRLNRDLRGKEDCYAKEELVAELTAAVTGSLLGISVTPDPNNASYLKHWLKVLKEEPKFLFSLFSMVNKASSLILQKVEEEEPTEMQA